MKNPQQLIQEEVDRIGDLKTRIAELHQRVCVKSTCLRIPLIYKTEGGFSREKGPFPQIQLLAIPIPENRIPVTPSTYRRTTGKFFLEYPWSCGATINFKGG